MGRRTGMPRIREGRGQADLRRGRAGTSPQHRTKSSNYLKPGTYSRRSCAERHVFTPGDPLRVLRGLSEPQGEQIA